MRILFAADGTVEMLGLQQGNRVTSDDEAALPHDLPVDVEPHTGAAEWFCSIRYLPGIEDEQVAVMAVDLQPPTRRRLGRGAIRLGE